MKTHVLCTIEQVMEVTPNGDGKSGILFLIQTEDSYDIAWIINLSYPRTPVDSVFQTIDETSLSNWKQDEPFRLNISQINRITLGDPLFFTIHCTKPRQFRICEKEFISLTQFYDEILYNGIAVLSPTENYCIEPYKSSRGKVFKFSPPHIHLQYNQFTTLANFWNDVEAFYWKLLIYIYKNNGLPSDVSFPLCQAARAAHKAVRIRSSEFVASLVTYPPFTRDIFDSLFDSTGRIKDPLEFSKRMYLSKIDPELLCDVVPFAFGLFSLTSTQSERDKLKIELARDFDLLRKQTVAVLPYQVEHNKRLAAAYRVIPQDVDRTDRLHPAFKASDGPGLSILTQLLKTFTNYDPAISYLQGMNDIFVPIILAYIPHWNDQGIPVNAAGEPVEYMQHLPLIFWNFDSLIFNTLHVKLIANVTEECQKQAQRAMQLVSKASPIAAMWMRRENLHELLWLYSDFLLLFKRSYDDVWPIWIPLTMSPDPKHWFTYFVAAIVFESFDELAQFQDTSLTILMTEYSKILEKIDITKITKTALWIYEKYKIDFEEEEKNQNIEPNFEFFKCASYTKYMLYP